MTTATQAYVYQSDESELRWMGRTATRFLATGALTGGNFALVDERAEQGESVPLHTHDDIESFYVLEGEVAFFLGPRPAVRVGAGGFVHIPGGTVHGFRIESASARYLILTTPRHGEFYRAITLPATHAVIAEAVIGKACQDYGIEFIGPLPA